MDELKERKWWTFFSVDAHQFETDVLGDGRHGYFFLRFASLQNVSPKCTANASRVPDLISAPFINRDTVGCGTPDAFEIEL